MLCSFVTIGHHPYDSVGNSREKKIQRSYFLIFPTLRESIKTMISFGEWGDCCCIRRRGTKMWSRNFSLYPLCRTFRRAVLDESQSSCFFQGVGCVVTNDWCIIYTENFCVKY